MKTEPSQPEKRKKSPLFTFLWMLAGLICVVIIAAILYPAPIVRYVFSRLEAESGIALTFDKAYFFLQDGSFLSIDGLTIKRHGHPTDNFDLRAETARMPAMFPGDFRSPVLLISGLRGTYERVGNEKTDNNQAEKEKVDLPLTALMLADAEVDFIDRTPKKPFRATMKLEECSLFKTSGPALFEPYTFSALGQIDSARFATAFSNGSSGEDRERLFMAIQKMPLGLLAPYAPALDDIFDSGSMDIKIDDLTDEKQKKIRIAITLLSDCKIKSADEILTPAVQMALQKLDQSSLPELRDLKGKIDKLESSDLLRTGLNVVTQLLPRDAREKVDRARGTLDKWKTLSQDLDRIKVNIVEDTFQRFIASGLPIEVDIQEVNGEWQYDAYETVIRLVENNYKTILTTEYQKRIQEIRDAVDRLLTL